MLRSRTSEGFLPQKVFFSQKDFSRGGKSGEFHFTHSKPRLHHFLLKILIGKSQISKFREETKPHPFSAHGSDQPGPERRSSNGSNVVSLECWAFRSCKAIRHGEPTDRWEYFSTLTAKPRPNVLVKFFLEVYWSLGNSRTLSRARFFKAIIVFRRGFDTIRRLFWFHPRFHSPSPHLAITHVSRTAKFKRMAYMLSACDEHIGYSRFSHTSDVGLYVEPTFFV